MNYQESTSLVVKPKKVVSPEMPLKDEGKQCREWGTEFEYNLQEIM